jgi:thiol-disulfide isomerase/thioredoxin
MQDAGKKRGAIVAGIALALVIAIAGAAYGLLAPKQSADGGASDVAVSSVSGAMAQGSAPESASGSATKTDIPMLADYDAMVYTDLNEPMRLTAIADGRPLVMNFWATWCPYCVQEFPDYKTLLSEYGDSVSFAFVDAPGSRGETVEKAQEWLAQNGFEEFPAYYDNDLEASSNFGARSLPTTVVVAANGEIQGASAGAIDLQRMRTALYTLTHES